MIASESVEHQNALEEHFLTKRNMYMNVPDLLSATINDVATDQNFNRLVDEHIASPSPALNTASHETATTTPHPLVSAPPLYAPSVIDNQHGHVVHKCFPIKVHKKFLSDIHYLDFLIQMWQTKRKFDEEVGMSDNEWKRVMP